jgi:hypothetical protein
MSQSAVNQDSVLLERESQAAPDPRVWASIQATLAAIRQDSAASPATYLEDTVVPHGGE